MRAQINQKAPLLSISAWVQGTEINFDQLSGQVVLVEVFQVNCPGCFLDALPQAIDLHRKYSEQGLSVLGVATAFEDFDKNNLENLTRLAEHGEVIGETLRILSQQGKLNAGCLPYRIPFPLAMDRLTQRRGKVSDRPHRQLYSRPYPQLRAAAKSSSTNYPPASNKLFSVS